MPALSVEAQSLRRWVYTFPNLKKRPVTAQPKPQTDDYERELEIPLGRSRTRDRGFYPELDESYEDLYNRIQAHRIDMEDEEDLRRKRKRIRALEWLVWLMRTRFHEHMLELIRERELEQERIRTRERELERQRSRSRSRGFDRGR